MAKDPYKYFRIEARELLDNLTQGVLDLERGDVSAETLGRLLRYAHTLKGAARVVGQADISEAAHGIEEILAPYREGGKTVDRQATGALLSRVDQIAERVSRLGEVAAETPAGTAARSPLRGVEEGFDTVRIEVAEMDRLLEQATESGVQIEALREDVQGLRELVRTGDAVVRQFARMCRQVQGAEEVLPAAEDMVDRLRRVDQNIAERLYRITRELEALQERAGELRLLPAANLFGSLERAVRDAAVLAGKSAMLVTAGGQHRLDAHVLRTVQDALVQVVRNAVAHGIESPQERAAAGKAASGRIVLEVRRERERIVFDCRDDGRGIDVAKVRQAAVRRGLLTGQQSETLVMEEGIELLLRGNVSTTSGVTELAGRGVGLDVVSAAVRKLNGEVRMSSVPGEGTRVQLAVPVSIEAMTVLDVMEGGEVVSIPFDAVSRTMRIEETDLAPGRDSLMLLHEGKSIPFVALGTLLGMPERRGARRRHFSAVVLEAGGQLAAVGAERLQGRSHVVVRPLPAAVGALPLVAGASFDGQGHPRLVLDAAGLVEQVHGHRAAAQTEEHHAKPSVLVIDDSMTTRMLEQSILEAAGFAVELAVSGEDGWEKAQEKSHAIFVVDVEMPGMDGFEFIRRVRADRDLRHTPAILVTSRNSPEDKRRAEYVGAQAYIVKGEFEEKHFLSTIRRLIG